MKVREVEAVLRECSTTAWSPAPRKWKADLRNEFLAGASIAALARRWKKGRRASRE